MENFIDDEDFITVRRPKRKNDPTISDDQNSSAEKKRRKNEEKDAKLTDVDFVDRSILKNIRVPKKIKECDDPLHRIDLQSKEFLREVNDVILRNMKEGGSTPPFEMKACYLIQSRQLQERYTKKRSELKEDSASRDNYGFCFFRELAAVREVAKKGVKIGNIGRSYLGTPENGVSLSQYADVAAQPYQLFGWIIICKYIKGRVNYVPLDTNPLEPQPGYHCHMPQKNTQQFIPVFYSTQVYLYEYSEDFDLMDYPSHVLPIAAVQIAATPGSNGGFWRKSVEESTWSRSQVQNTSPFVSPYHKVHLSVQRNIPDDTNKITTESRVTKSSEEPNNKTISSKQTSTRSTLPWPCGAHQLSGGLVVGSCIFRIPLASRLEAEALVVSFSTNDIYLPFGISTAVLTLNRFIDLEDLYTTIFRDGLLKLSLNREVHVPDVGYFSYYRTVLKDGSADKVAMINFTNYLKATNKACLMVTHLNDIRVVLFPDAPVARDIGLPQPDPMAHPFSLHCVVLASRHRKRFYEHSVGIPEFTYDIQKKEAATSHHHPIGSRILRFSFQQQAEAQRHYLLKKVDKAVNGSTFVYKPMTKADGDSVSGDIGSLTAQRKSRPKIATKVPLHSIPTDRNEASDHVKTPAPSSDTKSPQKIQDNDRDDDDDVDDLAVLDSIDQIDLEELSSSQLTPPSNEQQPSKQQTAGDSICKEVFHDPPASPNADRTIQKSDKVPVEPVKKENIQTTDAKVMESKPATTSAVTIPSTNVASKTSTPPQPKVTTSRADSNLIPSTDTCSKANDGTNIVAKSSPNPNNLFDSMQTQILSIVDTLKSHMNDPQFKAKFINQERPPRKSDEDNQTDSDTMKTSKEWYWFYHNQNQNGKISSNDENPGISPMSTGSPQVNPGGERRSESIQGHARPQPQMAANRNLPCFKNQQLPGLDTPSSSSSSVNVPSSQCKPYNQKPINSSHVSTYPIVSSESDSVDCKSFNRGITSNNCINSFRSPNSFQSTSGVRNQNPNNVSGNRNFNQNRFNMYQQSCSPSSFSSSAQAGPYNRGFIHGNPNSSQSQVSSYVQGLLPTPNRYGHQNPNVNRDRFNAPQSCYNQMNQSQMQYRNQGFENNQRLSSFGDPSISNQRPYSPEIMSTRDVDLRRVYHDTPSHGDFSNSMHDVDMRVIPTESQQTVYPPHRGSLLVSPNMAPRSQRPVSRISTYDPGLGFQ